MSLMYETIEDAVFGIENSANEVLAEYEPSCCFYQLLFVGMQMVNEKRFFPRTLSKCCDRNS